MEIISLSYQCNFLIKERRYKMNIDSNKPTTIRVDKKRNREDVPTGLNYFGSEESSSPLGFVIGNENENNEDNSGSNNILESKKRRIDGKSSSGGESAESLWKRFGSLSLGSASQVGKLIQEKLEGKSGEFNAQDHDFNFDFEESRENCEVAFQTNKCFISDKLL